MQRATPQRQALRASRTVPSSMEPNDNSHNAKKVANIAEGHVMIYHNLLDISFSCAQRISLSTKRFLTGFYIGK
jgi:hypothetical protein